MSESADPQYVNPSRPQHGLGPHVVGQRVVVRRLLRGRTGPSGGPAFTDVLGICLSWDERTCVVQPEAGPPVTLALADIVSGKPVPPRAPTRHRVPAAEAQRHGFALFPAMHTEPLGDWTLRHTPAATARRANSVLAFGPAGVEDAHDRVVDFYERRGARPVAAVLPDSPEDEAFRARGWVAESGDADTLFQLAGVSRVLRGLRGTPPAEVAYDERGGLVTVRIDERAIGVAAYAEDWVGVRSIEVDPAHRRRGLTQAVLAALLEWGAERGATTAYLQVLGDNAAAIALYERLGFRTHHAYRYLAAPPARPGSQPRSA